MTNIQYLSTADIGTFIYCTFLLGMATPAQTTFTRDIGNVAAEASYDPA